MLENLLMSTKKKKGNGPGPQNLEQFYQYPDDPNKSVGYYGYTRGDEMISAVDLIEMCGLTGKCTPMVGSDDAMGWLKYELDGKIYYIPRNGTATNITWVDLYKQGLVYGTDNNGTYPPPGVTGVNQKRMVSFQGFDFYIRMMTGASADVYTGGNAVADSPLCVDSEYTRVAYNLLPGANYGYQKGPKFITDPNGGLNGGYMLTQTSTTWYDDPNTYKLMRVGDQGRSNVNDVLTIRGDFVWFPVLEIILEG